MCAGALILVATRLVSLWPGNSRRARRSGRLSLHWHDDSCRVGARREAFDWAAGVAAAHARLVAETLSADLRRGHRCGDGAAWNDATAVVLTLRGAGCGAAGAGQSPALLAGMRIHRQRRQLRFPSRIPRIAENGRRPSSLLPPDHRRRGLHLHSGDPEVLGVPSRQCLRIPSLEKDSAHTDCSRHRQSSESALRALACA